MRFLQYLGSAMSPNVRQEFSRSREGLTPMRATDPREGKTTSQQQDKANFGIQRKAVESEQRGKT